MVTFRDIDLEDIPRALRLAGSPYRTLDHNDYAKAVKWLESQNGFSVNVNAPVTLGVPFKSAIAIATNDVSMASAGSLGVPDTGATLFAPASLVLGRLINGLHYLNGYVRRVAYWPTRLTDAQLRTLTG